MHNAILQAINGVSLAALLFLLASGFTLTFGLMRVVNMAHGAYTFSAAILDFPSPATPEASRSAFSAAGWPSSLWAS